MTLSGNVHQKSSMAVRSPSTSEGGRVAVAVMVGVFVTSVIAAALFAGLQSGSVLSGSTGNLAMEIALGAGAASVVGLMVFLAIEHYRRHRNPHTSTNLTEGTIAIEPPPVVRKPNPHLKRGNDNNQTLDYVAPPNAVNTEGWKKTHFYHNGRPVLSGNEPNRNQSVIGYFQNRQCGPQALQAMQKSTYTQMQWHMKTQQPPQTLLQEEMHFNFVELDGEIYLECFGRTEIAPVMMRVNLHTGKTTIHTWKNIDAFNLADYFSEGVTADGVQNTPLVVNTSEVQLKEGTWKRLVASTAPPNIQMQDWRKAHFYHNGRPVFQEPSRLRNGSIVGYFQTREKGLEALRWAQASAYARIRSNARGIDLPEEPEMHFNFVEVDGTSYLECFAYSSMRPQTPLLMRINLTTGATMLHEWIGSESSLNPLDYFSKSESQ